MPLKRPDLFEDALGVDDHRWIICFRTPSAVTRGETDADGSKDG
jgi:hypothetical protein